MQRQSGPGNPDISAVLWGPQPPLPSPHQGVKLKSDQRYLAISAFLWPHQPSRLADAACEPAVTEPRAGSTAAADGTASGGRQGGGAPPQPPQPPCLPLVFVAAAASDASLELLCTDLSARRRQGASSRLQQWHVAAALRHHARPVLCTAHAALPATADGPVASSRRQRHLVCSGSTDGSVAVWDVTHAAAAAAAAAPSAHAQWQQPQGQLPPELPPLLALEGVHQSGVNDVALAAAGEAVAAVRVRCCWWQFCAPPSSLRHAPRLRLLQHGTSHCRSSHGRLDSVLPPPACLPACPYPCPGPHHLLLLTAGDDQALCFTLLHLAGGSGGSGGSSGGSSSSSSGSIGTITSSASAGPRGCTVVLQLTVPTAHSSAVRAVWLGAPQPAVPGAAAAASASQPAASPAVAAPAAQAARAAAHAATAPAQADEADEAPAAAKTTADGADGAQGAGTAAAEGEAQAAEAQGAGTAAAEGEAQAAEAQGAGAAAAEGEAVAFSLGMDQQVRCWRLTLTQHARQHAATPALAERQRQQQQAGPRYMAKTRSSGGGGGGGGGAVLLLKVEELGCTMTQVVEPIALDVLPPPAQQAQRAPQAPAQQAQQPRGQRAQQRSPAEVGATPAGHAGRCYTLAVAGRGTEVLTWHVR